MKILFISGSFPGLKDGIGDCAYRLYEQYTNKTEVTLLTSNRPEIVNYLTEQNINTAKVFYIKNWKLNYQNLAYIIEIIKSQDINCIHIEYPGKGYGFNLLINFLPLIFKVLDKSKKIPVYVRYHEFSQSRWLRKIVDIPLLLAARKIFVPSYFDYHILYRFLRNKVHKTWIGSNISPIRSIKYIRKITQTNEEIILGYFGFIYQNKGFEDLLTIFKEISTRDPRCKLMIIGEFDPNHNEYHKQLQKIISEKKLDDKIIFTGYVENVKSVSNTISRVDIAILPFSDGLSLRRGSFLAFLQHKVPVITSKGDTECDFLFKNHPLVHMAKTHAEIVNKCIEWMKEFPDDVEDAQTNKINDLFRWEGISGDLLGQMKLDKEQYNKIELFNINIDNLNIEEVIGEICKYIQEREPKYIVTPNVDHVVKLQNDRQFMDVYKSANLVLTDGMPLIWASKLLKRPIKEKISGSDILPRICEVAERKGYKLFFLGAGPEIAERASRVLKRSYPNLQIVGAYSPTYGFENLDSENQYIIEMLIESKADILFVGLGAPKQEKWIFANRHYYQIPVSIGIGAAFDFVSGNVKRAPLSFQKLGLEWFWRFCQEPKRLFRRYFIEDMSFIGLFILEILKSLKKRKTVNE